MRVITADFRDTLEAQASTDVIVIFATITHPELSEPITVNSDVVDYVYGGYTYRGCAFALSLLSDDEQPPRAQVSIENVDQAIGNAIRAIADSPSIHVQIMVKSDFTDDDPRAAIGTPNVEYDAPYLKLRNVKVDAMTITADIVGYDLTTEPWPAIRSTQDRLPGLYR
jgi:hypothetical protein